MIEILLDIVVLLALLAAFLPFLLSAYRDVQDAETWGFTAQDDKTMRSYQGDSVSEGYLTDAYSAAEILLTARVMDYPAIAVSEWILPDGRRITVDLEYAEAVGVFMEYAQEAVVSGKEYQFVFDDVNNVWRVMEHD